MSGNYISESLGLISLFHSVAVIMDTHHSVCVLLHILNQSARAVLVDDIHIEMLWNVNTNFFFGERGAPVKINIIVASVITGRIV